ncbi:MAG: DUF1700 domain-containing protein [Johnsonella sp.]|nr:DUF1700 domain-containing protein [Johnsonella sp.]
MNKNEFLEGLVKALSSTGSRSLVNENIKYYSSYIEEEIRKGRREEEVMEELGDPRLIANSIKEAKGIEDEFSVLGSEDQKSYERFTNQRRSGEEDRQEHSGQKASKGFKMYSFGNASGKMALYGVLAFFLLLFVLLALIVVGLFKLLSPVLLPILMILMIMYFIRFFRNGRE